MRAGREILFTLLLYKSDYYREICRWRSGLREHGQGAENILQSSEPADVWAAQRGDTMGKIRRGICLLLVFVLMGLPVNASTTEGTDTGSTQISGEDEGIQYYAYDAVLYSNALTALYAAAEIQSEVILTADQFPDDVPVQVVGITSTGFYQADVGGIYYIPEIGLDAQAPEETAAASETSDSQAGLQEQNGQLVYVLEDGSLLKDGYYQYLYFDENGNYTSGSEELDLLVDAALAACTDDSMTQSEKLRAAYVYVRDNFTYLSRDHHSRGVNDWTEESAVFMFTNGKGNCYCFAGAFLYLARRIGYSSAYPVSGGVGTTNADHAWVMITMEDGVEYMFDVELEYAYLYRYANKHAYNLYQMTTATAPWRYYFP